MCGICCIFHSSGAAVVQDEVDQVLLIERSATYFVLSMCYM